MTLRIHTARISYRGPDRLDITRAGADAARRKGEPFPGEPWAPSWGILKPALDARRRAQELARFAESALADHFDGDDPSDHASEEAAEIEADAWAI